MKRIFAIILFAVYLFNLAGYSLFYQYHITRADAEQLARIDKKDFKDEELREIKIPIDLPYYNISGEFERIDGAVEVNGKQYNYVKRKVSGDTLYLMCLPNDDKTQLYKDRHSYASGANDLPANNKSESGAKKNGFSNEYIESFTHLKLGLPTTVSLSFYSLAKERLTPGFAGESGQPPQTV